MSGRDLLILSMVGPLPFRPNMFLHDDLSFRVTRAVCFKLDVLALQAAPTAVSATSTCTSQTRVSKYSYFPGGADSLVLLIPTRIALPRTQEYRGHPSRGRRRRREGFLPPAQDLLSTPPTGDSRIYASGAPFERQSLLSRTPSPCSRKQTLHFILNAHKAISCWHAGLCKRANAQSIETVYTDTIPFSPKFGGVIAVRHSP